MLTVYKVNNFSHALKLAKKILKFQGQGHSCSIHSKNKSNILKIGKELPVSRVIVNQIHSFATGGVLIMDYLSHFQWVVEHGVKIFLMKI